MNNLDHNRLLVKIAQMYFEDDLTQHQIAARLRLSRQKVQRLIQQARQEGIVQIGIRPIMGIFSDLEKAIETRYGLREAIVVATSDYNSHPTVAHEVGVAAAEYLLRVIRSKDQIVISWGESLLGMVNAVSYGPRVNIEGVRVIQGLGGLGDPNHEAHGAELTRRLAKALDAEAVLLPAQGVAGSRSMRNAMVKDRYVSQALETAREATLAVMGLGAPRPDSILVQEGRIVQWAELEALMKAGAAGDINLRYFDAHGRAVTSDLDERVIGLTLGEIKRIGHVVGVAGGSAKLKAIRGALEGKLIDVLVTDHVTAQNLLNKEANS
jgi:DNA-binding transcriptional regulator LsrR (DeoR family)